MLNLSNKYLVISLLSFAITVLCIFKINNVHELRKLNASLDNEISKQIILESKFIEMNNKLLYKKSFLEANKNSQINLAMIKPKRIEALIFREANEN